MKMKMKNKMKKLIEELEETTWGVDGRLNSFAQMMVMENGKINPDILDYVNLILESQLLSRKWLRTQSNKTQQQYKQIKRICKKIKKMEEEK